MKKVYMFHKQTFLTASKYHGLRCRQLGILPSKEKSILFTKLK